MKLKPCPCGEVPTELSIDCSDCKWFSCCGNCCGEWSIEFRSDYLRWDKEEKKITAMAVKAWNETKRA